MPKMMPAGLQVHVLPVGWEYDRAVEPFMLPNADSRRQHAHRIYLVVPGEQGAQGFPDRVQAALEEMGIEVIRRVVDRERDGKPAEFEATLEAVSDICHEEAFRNGNHVHINISSGSKIGAFATGLAGMAYQKTGRVSLYYVQPETYTETETDVKKRGRMWERSGLSVGVRNVLDLQLIPLVQYSRSQLQVLAFLRQEGGKASLKDVLLHLIPYPESDLGDFADLLPQDKAKAAALPQTQRAESVSSRGTPVGPLRDLQNRALGRLRTLVRPLREGGWVEVKQMGRARHLLLTDAGKVFALLAKDEAASQLQEHTD